MSFIRHHKARLPELSSSPYQLSAIAVLPPAFLRFSENKVPGPRILLHLTRGRRRRRHRRRRRGIDSLNNKGAAGEEKKLAGISAFSTVDVIQPHAIIL